jgi:hypothetical protein
MTDITLPCVQSVLNLSCITGSVICGLQMIVHMLCLGLFIICACCVRCLAWCLIGYHNQHKKLRKIFALLLTCHFMFYKYVTQTKVGFSFTVCYHMACENVNVSYSHQGSACICHVVCGMKYIVSFMKLVAWFRIWDRGTHGTHRGIMVI